MTSSESHPASFESAELTDTAKVLSVCRLSVSQSEKNILESVSFHVNSNEVVAIIGPNGAGKSTLLHALAGGRDGRATYLDKRKLSSHSASDIAQIIAVHTQHNHMPFNFTVREIVQMGRYPFSTGSTYDESIVNQALSLADMVALQDHAYTDLSGGEQQRTHVARVLAQAWPDGKPHFLLLDEPTSALDFNHQISTLNAIKTFSKQQVGAVFVTHDINLASQYADRIIVLHQGKVYAQGEPKNIMQVEVLSPVFGSQLTQIYDEQSGHHFLFCQRG